MTNIAALIIYTWKQNELSFPQNFTDAALEMLMLSVCDGFKSTLCRQATVEMHSINATSENFFNWREGVFHLYNIGNEKRRNSARCSFWFQPQSLCLLPVPTQILRYNRVYLLDPILCFGSPSIVPN